MRYVYQISFHIGTTLGINRRVILFPTIKSAVEQLKKELLHALVVHEEDCKKDIKCHCYEESKMREKCYPLGNIKRWTLKPSLVKRITENYPDDIWNTQLRVAELSRLQLHAPLYERDSSSDEEQYSSVSEDHSSSSSETSRKRIPMSLGSKIFSLNEYYYLLRSSGTLLPECKKFRSERTAVAYCRKRIKDNLRNPHRPEASKIIERICDGTDGIVRGWFVEGARLAELSIQKKRR